ncbi:hypothetical protein CANCADRAFT_30328 [Tortispora caseinolytica NRRL Y-17796]|uniref:Ribosomal RNA-processing protein 7 C-terminal domain-containing protein n=1 Tax=Tortispora caseinolytica NRRL Y-17796 TaxID=767744 RepID=A0A1E4TK07_9ASCO|nr:hypothetical protein CANCADRAFT_30328 [Tortispora caseinolytica NRRL Y-17796]
MSEAIVDDIEFNAPESKEKRVLWSPGSTDLSSVYRPLYPSGSTCVIHFVDTNGVKRVIRTLKSIRGKKIEATHSSVLPLWGEGIGSGNNIPPLGSKRYRALQIDSYGEYEFMKHIEQDVNECLKQFNEKEEDMRKAAEQDGMDEDGFVTVKPAGVRGTQPTPLLSASDIQVNKKKKSRSTGLTDFYRFQVRDQKKRKVDELLHRFQEDREKLNQLTRSRRLKPE